MYQEREMLYLILHMFICAQIRHAVTYGFPIFCLYKQTRKINTHQWTKIVPGENLLCWNSLPATIPRGWKSSHNLIFALVNTADLNKYENWKACKIQDNILRGGGKKAFIKVVDSVTHSPCVLKASQDLGCNKMSPVLMCLALSLSQKCSLRDAFQRLSQLVTTFLF